MKWVIPCLFLVVCLSSVDGAEDLVDSVNLPPRWEFQQDVFASFNEFTPLNEHDLGAVFDIIQDRTGFIWLAGEKGLGRYDGYEFRVYHADTIQGSLHGDLISSLAVDEQGCLWVGHAAGISVYQENNNTFRSVFGAFEHGNVIVDSIYVRALIADGDSLIWFETADGWLYQYHRKSATIKKLQRHQNVSQPYYRYHAIIKDKDGDLFVGGRGIPPMNYDMERNLFSRLPVDPNEIPGTKREPDVSVFFADKPGFIWVGGVEGIYLYEKSRDYLHKFKSGTVYDMIRSRDGNYWLGSGNGAYRINPQTGEGTIYRLNNNDPKSLGGERIYDVYEDRSGRIWLAHENGVSTFQPLKPGIKYLFHIPGLEQTPASNRISSLARKNADELWIGTIDGGIDVMNIQTSEFKHYNPTTNPGILSPHIRVLKNHPDGSLYIGYWEGRGFGRLLKGSNDFEYFSYDPSSFKKDWYNDFEFDQQGDVYLGFWGGPGLTIFNHNEGVFGAELASQLPDPYYNRLINALTKSDDGKLWIATTQSGVVCYDEINKQSSSYFEAYRAGSGITEKLIYDVAKDHKGNIWACGSQLYVYDSLNDCFIEQALGVNVKSMEIFRIHPAQDGNLWLLTSKGLMRYDPDRIWLTDFSSHVQLSFKYTQAAALQWDEDMLILGGSNGLALIETDKLGFRHVFPRVFLTHLDVFNETYFPLLENLEKVNLAHNQNFFAIHFGTDRWEKDQPYTYFYQLEGFDNEWRLIVPQQKSIYFTNVPSGSYTFKMRTGDAYGNKSDQEARLVIHIKTAWWRQWWFYTISVLLIVGFFGFLWYLRILDEKLKWQNTDLNQQLLRLQMNPHFIFNSLTSIQNYIYTNQTHLAGQYLSDFARLIRLILENSRHESISLDKEIETIQLYMSLQKLRFTRKIDFSIKVDPEIDTEVTYVPPMMAQPFLENALEHGIKNNDKDGVIEVSYQLIGSRIRFEVRDNGIGIAASKKMIHDSQSAKHESLSIAICMERIQLLERKSKRKIPFIFDEIIEDGQVNGTRVAFEIPLKGSFISKKFKA